MSRGEIFRALHADVTSMEDLLEELINLYPEREKTFRDTFRSYGK